MAAQKFDWLNKFTRKTKPIRRNARLGAESLESRDVPATYLVTTSLDDVLGTQPGISLREAIQQANAHSNTLNAGGAPDIIRIEPTAAGTCVLGADMEQITESVTIQLNASTAFYTLDGAGTWQLLNATKTGVAAVTVTVDKVQFTNGVADASGPADDGNGGAISVTNANLILKNSFVTSSDAFFNGGGISVTDGNLSVFNTDFADNNALGGSGGAISVTALPGTGHTVQITDAVIGVDPTDTTSAAGNTAAVNGGGLFASGANVTIKGAYVKLNTAGGDGGGVYVADGNLTVTRIGTVGVRSSILQNSAGGSGGGIATLDTPLPPLTTTVLVTGGTTVDNNVAANQGGGIWSSGTTAKVTVNAASTVNGNKATNEGGGIFGDDGVDIVVDGAAKVDGNHVESKGGGIYSIGGSVLVRGASSVSGNSATSAGGLGGPGGGIAAVATPVTDGVFGSILDYVGGDITVSGAATVSGNTAYGNGGGLFSNAGSVRVSNAAVRFNQSQSGNGGGIEAIAGELFTGGGSFTNLVGGTVSALNGANVSDNGAFLLGGGIHTLGGRVIIAGATTRVSDNNAGLTAANGGGGGGVAAVARTDAFAGTQALGGDISMSGGTVSGNFALGNGGGLYAFGGDVSLAGGAAVTGNTSLRSGGGVNADAAPVLTNPGGMVTATGKSVVSNNFATLSGGGIWAATSVDAQDLQANGNTANIGDGGGIYSGGAVTLVDTDRGPEEVEVFLASASGNTAGGDGGGVYALGNVTLTNAVADGNTATGNGGGIWAAPGTVVTVEGTNAGDPDQKIRRVTVSDNTAGGDGGGIYGDDVELSYVTIDGNTATVGDGGGIYADTAGVFASTISHNAAGDEGGGAYLTGTNGISSDFANSTISSNTAADGAGIWFGGAGTAATPDVVVNLASTTVVLNKALAGAVGGGFSGGDDTLVTNNSIIAGNTAGLLAKDIGNPNAAVLENNQSRNNLIGNAASSGGILNGAEGNIVGVAVDTVIVTTGGPDNDGLADNGGPTLTHALAGDKTTNPAFNAGSLVENATLRVYNYTFDQRGPGSLTQPGFPRVDTDTGVMDIGAVEGTAKAADRALVASVFSANGVVSVRNKLGEELYTIAPLTKGVNGTDFRVTVGDLNGDDNPDVIVASGAGGGQVMAFNGDDGSPLWAAAVSPYGAAYTKGLFVASGGGKGSAADVNGDGQNDVVVGPGSSGQTVRVLSGDTGAAIAGKNAFTPLGGVYPNGVRVGLGDANNDGDAEVYIIPGPGVSARLEVWNLTGAGFGLLRGFTTYNTSGATISVRDLNGDGLAEVAVGSSSGSSRVQIFQGASIYNPALANPISPNPQTGKVSLGLPGPALFTPANSQQEVRTTIQDVDGDGDLDLVVATGPNVGLAPNNVQEARVFDLSNPAAPVLIDVITAGELGLPLGYAAGIFVA